MENTTAFAARPLSGSTTRRSIIATERVAYITAPDIKIERRKPIMKIFTANRAASQ